MIIKPFEIESFKFELKNNAMNNGKVFKFYFFKKYIILVLILLFSIINLKSIIVADAIHIDAKSAILIDADEGKIIYQLRDQTMYPCASMTKMMTEYLLLEKIKKNEISWNNVIPISNYAYKISQNMTLSNVPLRKNGYYTVKDLYEAMVIYSANGASIAIAEYISGSELKFVKLMNQKAKELELREYKFVNCTGLNNNDLEGMYPENERKNDENILSARAVVKLAYCLIRDYPDVLETARMPKKDFKKGSNETIAMVNWNWMLPGLIYYYKGMDGLKTGSSSTAGYCFTGTAKQNGMRLISVVMGAKSYTARFMETKKLMDYGFKNYIRKCFIPVGYDFNNHAELPVVKGVEKSVKITTLKPLYLTIKKGEENLYKIIFKRDLSLYNKNGILIAPLKKKQKIGYLSVLYKGNKNYEFLTDIDKMNKKIEVVTQKEIKKASWLTLVIRSINNFIAKLFAKILHNKLVHTVTVNTGTR